MLCCKSKNLPKGLIGVVFSVFAPYFRYGVDCPCIVCAFLMKFHNHIRQHSKPPKHKVSRWEGFPPQLAAVILKSYSFASIFPSTSFSYTSFLLFLYLSHSVISPVCVLRKSDISAVGNRRCHPLKRCHSWRPFRVSGRNRLTTPVYIQGAQKPELHSIRNPEWYMPVDRGSRFHVFPKSLSSSIHQ